MEVSDISVKLIVGQVKGQLVARCSDVATRVGGVATQRHQAEPEHMHPEGATVVLEEDAATVTKLFFVRLVSKCRL